LAEEVNIPLQRISLKDFFGLEAKPMPMALAATTDLCVDQAVAAAPTADLKAALTVEKEEKYQRLFLQPPIMKYGKEKQQDSIAVLPLHLATQFKRTPLQLVVLQKERQHNSLPVLPLHLEVRREQKQQD